MSEMRIAPAPLYKCPIGDGAASAKVIWNRQEKCWFMFYEPRNKNAVLRDDDALCFCFGTDIGIASSKDNGRTWVYRGVAEGLSIEPGRNTWGEGQEVIFHDGLYHLFCFYLQGYPVPRHFNDPSHLTHYTSKDLWHWTFHSFIKEDDHRKNSICVYRLPTGKWRMFYNDDNVLSLMESDDLYDWEYIGKNVDAMHNSTNVFKLGGYYWMTFDTYVGYAVFRSNDCENWTRQDGLLFDEISERMDDGARPHHSSVVELPNDQVYFFYYTHPERVIGQSAKVDPRLPDKVHGLPHLRRSVIQVAEVKVKDGRLVGNRNEPFDFYLPNLT